MLCIIAASPSIQALLSGVLALILYLNTIHGAFILDDWSYLVNNPLIRDFNFLTHLGNLRLYVLEQGIDLGKTDVIYNVTLRPLSYLTFALNYQLHGLEIAGYKVINIFFHVTATMLTYTFTYLLQKQIRITSGDDETSSTMPFLVAILFACHPVQTQAVSYIIQRFTAIAACFYLLALIAYLMSRSASARNRVLLWYTLALSATIAGMLSKENVFTLPLMITFVECLCFRDTIRKRILILTPFLATMAFIPLTVMRLTGQFGTLRNNIQLVNFDQVPHLTYIITEFRVLLTYLRLLILPVNQQLDYDYPIFDSLLAPPVACSLLGLLALALFALYALSRGRKLALPWLTLTGFGIIWFFLTLVVESGLVPTEDVIFEHRLYLPSIGFFMVAISSVLRGLSFFAARRHWQIFAGAVMIVIVTALSCATVRRNYLWADALRFWQDNAVKSPHKSRVLQCLGDTYLLHGNTYEAIAAYEKIPLTIATTKNADICINLGDAYMKIGDFAKGVQMYKRAISFAPDNYVAYSNLGMKYAMRSEFDSALELLDKAVKVNKFDLMSRRARVDIFMQLGRNAEAIAEYEGILSVWPNDAYALDALRQLRR